MSSDSRLPEYLPQYGFGPETEFKTLVEKNPFLFRLHTPRASRDPFTALPFEGSHTSDVRRQSLDPPLATYSDVIRHMDWTTRHSSPYISASFSFMWAIWEALRRYHFGVKHDVEIAVIDATAVSSRSITVVELMRSVAFTERHESHWKWYHSAQESQTVLIYGSIPRSAILASIPILRVLDKLPSYCLSPLTSSPFPTPVHRAHWTYIIQNPNFRRFCAAQSASFLRTQPRARFQDSTVGAVQLSLAFLGTWFYWMLQLQPPRENDPNIFRDAAVTKVSELARAIAFWPFPGETIYLWDSIVREISVLVADEVKNHSRISDLEISLGAPRNSSEVAEEFSSAVSTPIVLDPRNFLPTPPPTPPPPSFTPIRSAAECAPEPQPSALSPQSREVDIDSRTEKFLDTFDAPHVVDTRSPPHYVPENQADPRADTEPEVFPPAPASASSQQYAQAHSVGETASCLLTGFLFGALLVIVLSQRRPTLMHLS